jgi:putative transposase
MWHRQNKTSSSKISLAQWPVEMPQNWQSLVNQQLNEKEADDLNKCIERNRPFGEIDWMIKTASSLGLDSTLKTRGRPRIAEKGS